MPHPVPVIGISGMNTDSKMVATMVAQVRADGGIPIVLANHATRDAAADIQKLDAVIIMGNDFDVDPNKYIDKYPKGDPRKTINPKTLNQMNTPASAARAAYEDKLISLAKDKHMPTLAVCAGMQTINVIQGGGLLQDIPELIGNDSHMQAKQGYASFSPVIPVDINVKSQLGKIAEPHHLLFTAGYSDRSVVHFADNSFHHQAIDPDMLGTGLRIVAWSDTFKNVQGETRRLPEAIEPDPHGPLKDWPMIGVQWHPEAGASPISAKVIANLVEKGEHNAKHSDRDRSKDENVAFVENYKSANKTAPTGVDAKIEVLAPAQTPPKQILDVPAKSADR